MNSVKVNATGRERKFAGQCPGCFAEKAKVVGARLSVADEISERYEDEIYTAEGFEESFERLWRLK